MTPRAHVATGLAAITLVLAGCGGASKTGVAHLSTDQSNAPVSAENGAPSAEDATSSQSRTVAYARCMRAHGAASFPEPVEGRIMIHPGSGIDPGSAQFQAAERACEKLLPDGGGGKGEQTQAQRQQHVDGELAFASCMRSHGVPTFPDPDSQGELKSETVKSAGVNVHSPVVQSAAQTCLPAAGGAITESEVKRAERAGP